ncbi:MULTISPECIES: hypothetical protein [unclassified Pedobacter]|uniref:hypothetical protein n=1 Tax=unclassified Pedobacter TaxID=2628915 RepID=UPI001E45FA8B|nr:MULTISPECIES: hypothetical protein [unclassified Pedobacter]
MQSKVIKFQHPFRELEETISYSSPAQTVQSFLEINWEQLNIDIYEKHDEVIHDYYFFEVSYMDLSNHKHTLNIGGAYTHGKNLEINGPQFDVRYSRPIEKTNRGFLGLGALKTKTMIDEMWMEECNKSFVVKCLEAFLKHDKQFLESEIINNGVSSF